MSSVTENNMNMYKENFDAMQMLPLVQKLKLARRKLKSENTKLLRAFMNLLSMVEPASKNKAKSSSKRGSLRPTAVKQSQPTVKQSQPTVKQSQPTVKQSQPTVKQSQPKVKVEKDVSVVSNDDDSVEIVVPKTTPNIVYEIIDEEEVSDDANEEEDADAGEEEDADAGEEEDADAGEAEEEAEEDADAGEAEDANAGEEEDADAGEEEDADAGEAGEEEDAEEEEEDADADANEEEEEVKEVIINKKTYYTDDEKNGTIYDVDENGDVSLEVGKFVKGVAKFY
jgi:cobalamin biosynthesis protein CobT